jgi:aspartate--ammonia ligase, AsnA-type
MKAGIKSFLSLRETQKAICQVKEYFPCELSRSLNLFQVSAPLFVRAGTGINDDLNGVEKPISFTIKADGAQAEIVHSLAKWKRIALQRYGCSRGEGIYTDMRAIRADEECDAIHSLYVDQWDWEQVIEVQDRTLEYLTLIVKRIYGALKATEMHMHDMYPELKPRLPEDINFVHSEQLASMLPALSRKEREYEICKRYGAVFLIGIGGDLDDGMPHDGRAPDYDDWSTPTSGKHSGLNGDILVWDDILGIALELSSMGIRVDKAALKRQLALKFASARSSLMFHKMLLDDALPLSIGGGIGQSRVCMYMLHKAHIMEVQESVWPAMCQLELAL